MDRPSLEKQVSDKIGASHELIRKLYRLERRGVLTEDMLRDELISDALYAMNLLFSKNGLRRRIDHGNWPRFLDDHALFKAGGQAGSVPENDWLRYNACEDRQRSGREENVPYAWVSAPGWAKEQFFRVIDEFCVPPEYFAPMPKDIPDPNDIMTHRYGSSSDHLITFECVDDGGLLHDPDPAGRHFSLIGPQGTRAEITVLRVYAPGEEKEFRNHHLPVQAGSMEAKGWLEGYMTEREHSLSIDRPRGRVLSFSVTLDNDDENLFFSYPLWERFFAWHRQRSLLLNESLYARFRVFIDKERAT